MGDISQRLSALSPEHRKLFEQQLEKKNLQALASSEPFDKVEKDARGLSHRDEESERALSRPATADQTMQFSLFFFSADGSTDTAEKYRLLIESAQFADEHGFSAVWTPERHFQDFGGLYPNPSVLGAALAMITQRIQIRAGSVALPLHHPLRVAEEWSVVDNLSGGRVSISFASGWHPLDFVLAPVAYHDRKELMFRHIETIQRLWAGEALSFPGVDGKEVAVRLLPRPLQRNLPIWITISNNAESWVRAGEIGANVLTAIGRQPLAALAEKISLYRQARVAHGHDPQLGQVTVMVHTFVGDDDESVRETVRPALSRYFRTNLQQLEIQTEVLISTQGNHSSLELEELRDDDADSIASFAFQRYYETTLLCGTLQKCSKLIQSLADLGVNEVACLIDFGVDAVAVKKSLLQLNNLREQWSRPAAESYVA
jgi:natural product biosynthesis luciferase-like monooxygenase protein